ncbi:glycosyltransferase [Flavobacterium circumlabens]|uniref:Glycosyltransferase n=1 Tax=Flavobacterium circumlabens TaxID=2133765 RepID=A0A4Y7UB11_9FLAO|nr:glycosyltransferase [Flavobacterium circumlabens]TCN56387.1 glycosyltransferase involved in cell wall biosynthesis [Flavobacterium circumlabens]TEB43421.1 glycosyltransferase [Flavobacterium circumlabens]
MSKNLKVTVCMITYGHEKFIEEAINGVLMQEIDFDIELLISNDASPDKTDEIVKSIIENHPRGSWIRYIKHDSNIGMMPNSLFVLEASKGEFIAVCEGDDYWTDPLKLQKQVAFLEANPEYVMCFHRCQFLTLENGKNKFVDQELEVIDYEYNLYGLLYHWNIPTASIVFKNVFLEEDNVFPYDFLKVQSGDIALASYLFQFGKFFLFKEIMSVYRVFGLGVSVTHKDLRMIHYRANLYFRINEYYNFKYEAEIYQALHDVMNRYAPVLCLEKNAVNNYSTRKLIYILYRRLKRKITKR